MRNRFRIIMRLLQKLSFCKYYIHIIFKYVFYGHCSKARKHFSRSSTHTLECDRESENTNINRFAYLCDTFGPRYVGTPALDAALSWIVAEMKADGIISINSVISLSIVNEFNSFKG